MHRRLPTVSVFLCLAAGVLLWPVDASAQSTELFFSEYVEGSSFNKALEIYNGTGADVDLAAGGYNIQMFFNGSSTAAVTIDLTGTIANGDAFVITQTAASQALRDLADQIHSSSSWFNGDDAIALRKGSTIVDVIGQIGVDPGSEWGSGVTSTQDNTIRRKSSVLAGDPDGSDAFDPALEWAGFAQDTFSGLGSHNAVPPFQTKHIWEIQGGGLLSPYAGALIRTEGVVTAAFPAGGGFFIQAPEGGDGVADTSDGLFVFTGGAPITVAAGDKVQVTGEITEFFNMTEMVSPAVVRLESGLAIPAPEIFNASTPSPNQPQPATEMERYESMLVQVVDGLVSSPTNQFGEASVVATGIRPFREPGILFPGLPGLPVWDGNPEIFEIDTDLYEAEPHKLLAAGSTVTAVGPLAFSFSDYQIWPTVLEATGSSAVVPVRTRDAGEFTVGSQNFLRLFDLVDDPDTSDDVPTDVLYGARLTKLSLYVRNSLGAPDVLAVQEVENIVALQDVADRIRADDPTIVYSVYLEEGNDIGGIDVGFLVRDTMRVDSIEQIGRDTVFSFPGVSDTRLNDRPPLVLRGAYVDAGALFPLTVINVHQRSLSGVEAADGRVRQKRYEQALELSKFIDQLQDTHPGERLVVIGDFNAFEFTDGYVDVMGQVTGSPDPAGALLPATDEISQDLTNQTLNMPADQRYSFVFDGTAQSLDHAITSQGLDPFVRGAQHARGNADAPFDYDHVADTALRSSDHDGTVLFLTTDLDSDGVPDNLDACTDTRIPEGVPTDRLNPNHYALVDGDRTFDTAAPPGRAGRMPSFSIADTAGCSCEQILDRVATLEAGERKFGCSVGTMQNWTGR
jgi:predicted extracellular nuclease